MKKYYRFVLMAAVVCGISLAVTSCKDDDNNSGNGGATNEEQAAEDANTFWGVVANLVNPFDVTDEYKNKTFEPTIGEAETGSSTVRVVTVPDVEAAANHFAAIVDADVKAGTATYTYQNDAVGKLTYTKSTDGKSLAKVDVSIKQIPHLQQIVYKTVEQMGTNAITDGVPYYSFGDVISRTRGDGVKEYWMCIQTPFTKQGETKAVWASVSQLPAENIWSYTSKAGNLYQVPTKLGNNKEYMKDLAEMIYAINSPAAWESNLTDGPADMKAFNLVTKQNVKYINKYFWTRVMQAWQKKKLATAIFGVKDISDFGFTLTDTSTGLRLVYHGYSWWTKTSNNLSLYEATILRGEGKEANARKLTCKEVKKNVISPMIEVNCVSQLQNGSQWINKNFFGEDGYVDYTLPRYIFRFATTKELAGTGAFESMNNINGIQEEYVYTQEYGITPGARQQMDDNIVKEEEFLAKISADEVKVGYFLAADGKFCETLNDANENHKGAVAVVAYLGDSLRVEKGTEYNGLAISRWVPTSYAWSSSEYNDPCPGVKICDMFYDAEDDFSGLATTEILAGGCGNLQHSHPAAKFCHDFELKVTKRNGAISSWFLPSLGQWILAVQGLGGTKDEGVVTIGGAELWDVMMDNITQNRFWTSTVKNESNSYFFSTNFNLANADDSKMNTPKVLAFIAFKYGNGGKEDPEIGSDDYE